MQETRISLSIPPYVCVWLSSNVNINFKSLVLFLCLTIESYIESWYYYISLKKYGTEDVEYYYSDDVWQGNGFGSSSSGNDQRQTGQSGEAGREAGSVANTYQCEIITCDAL